MPVLEEEAAPGAVTRQPSFMDRGSNSRALQSMLSDLAREGSKSITERGTQRRTSLLDSSVSRWVLSMWHRQ